MKLRISPLFFATLLVMAGCAGVTPEKPKTEAGPAAPPGTEPKIPGSPVIIPPVIGTGELSNVQIAFTEGANAALHLEMNVDPTKGDTEKAFVTRARYRLFTMTGDLISKVDKPIPAPVAITYLLTAGTSYDAKKLTGKGGATSASARIEIEDSEGETLTSGIKSNGTGLLLASDGTPSTSGLSRFADSYEVSISGDASDTTVLDDFVPSDAVQFPAAVYLVNKNDVADVVKKEDVLPQLVIDKDKPGKIEGAFVWYASGVTPDANESRFIRFFSQGNAAHEIHGLINLSDKSIDSSSVKDWSIVPDGEYMGETVCRRIDPKGEIKLGGDIGIRTVLEHSVKIPGGIKFVSKPKEDPKENGKEKAKEEEPKA